MLATAPTTTLVLVLASLSTFSNSSWRVAATATTAPAAQLDASTSTDLYQRRLELDRIELKKAGFALDTLYRPSRRRQRRNRAKALTTRQDGPRVVNVDETSPRLGDDSIRKTEALPASTSSTTLKPFNYATDKIRGVSLGGWLVSEPFIKPSLYYEPNRADPRIQDEWTFCRYQKRSVAEKALRAHWDSWITADDVKKIAAAGLNHLRIPVGYWAVEVGPGEPYVTGSLVYLNSAITWAKAAGLRVMIDLHGAPGSQNGLDNSGRRGEILWHTNKTNVARTRKVLKVLADEFSKAEYKNIVTAIRRSHAASSGSKPDSELTVKALSTEPVNEPWGLDPAVLPVVDKYYYDGFKIARFSDSGQQRDLLYVIHDAFQGVEHWQDFMRNSTYNHKVMVDTHIYSIFDDTEIHYTEAERITHYCNEGQRVAALSAGGLAPVVGEWSTASTDCNQKFPKIKYQQSGPQLIGWGSRYDGTYPGSKAVGSCTNKTGTGKVFSREYRDQLGRFWEAQVTAYERGSGWFMWTWKTETTHDFSYEAGLDYGWIPRNVKERRWQDLCTVSPPKRASKQGSAKVREEDETEEEETAFEEIDVPIEETESPIEEEEPSIEEEEVVAEENEKPEATSYKAGSSFSSSNLQGSRDSLYEAASTMLLIFTETVESIMFYVGVM